MPPLISPPLRPHGVPGECEPGWMAAGGAAGGRGQPAPGRRASPGRGEPDPRGRGGRATKGSFANCLHVWRSLLLPPERVPDPHIRPRGMRDAGSGVRDGGCGMRHIGCERWDVGCGPVLTPRRCRPRVPRHRAREPEGKEGRKDVKSPKISRSRTGRGGEGRAAGPLRRAPSASQQPTEKKKNPNPTPGTQMEPPPPPTIPPLSAPPQPCARSPLPAARPAPPGTPLLSALPCTLLVGVFLSCRKFLMLSIMQAASPALPRLPSKGQTCAGHPAHTTAQESLPSPQPPGICSLLAAPSLPFYFQLLQSEPPPPSPRWR